MNSARIFPTLRVMPALAATLLLAAAALVDAQVPPPNAAVEYDAQLCRDLGGDLETSGGGAEVCSNLDANDTFCIIGEQQALPCRGLFKHVITCNAAYNRPALNPFFCGARCGGETPLARGNACEKPIADLDAVVSRVPATIIAASGFAGPAYVVRASADYALRDFQTDSEAVSLRGATVILLEKFSEDGAAAAATIAAKALCDGCYPAFVTVVAVFIPLLAPDQPRPDAEVGVSISGVTFVAPTEAAGGTFSLLGAERGGAALAAGALTVDSAAGELGGLLSGAGAHVVSVGYESAAAPGEPGHFLGTLALLMTVNAQWPPGALLDPPTPTQSRLVAPGYAGSVAFFRGGDGVTLTLASDISSPGFAVPAGVFVAPEGFTVALTDALADGGAKTVAFTIAARAPGGVETAVPVTVAAIPLLAPEQPRLDAEVGVSISGVTFVVPTEAAEGIFSLLGAEWGGAALLAADALTVDSAAGELSGLLSGVGEYVVSVAYETAVAPGEPGHFLGTLALLMTVNAQGPLLEEPPTPAQSRLVAPSYAGSLAFFRGTEGVALTLAPDISPPGFAVPAGVFAAPEGFTVALTDALAGGGAKTVAFTIAARAPGGAETAVPVTVAAIPLLAPEQPRLDAEVGVSISGVTFAVPTEAAGGTFSLLGAEWGGAALAADALTVDSAAGELRGLLSGVGEYVVSVAYETAAAPGAPGHFLGTLALLMTVNAQGPLLEEPPTPSQSRLVAPSYAGSLAFFRGTEGVRLTLAPDISPPGFGVPAGVFVAPEGFTVALTDALAGGGAKTVAFTIAARAPGGAETAVPVTVAAIPLLAPDQPRLDAEVGVSISGVTFVVPTEAAGGIFSLLGAEWGGAALAADALTVDSAVGELRGLLSGVGEYVVSVAYETAVAPGEPGHFLGTLALLMTVNAQGPLLEPPAPAQSRLVAPTYAGSLAFFRGTEGVRLTLAPDISPPGFAVPAGVFVAPEGFTVALTDALGGGGGKTVAFTIAARAPGVAETAVPVTVAAIPLLAPEQPRPETTFGVSISGVTFVAPAEASGGVFSFIGAERGGVAERDRGRVAVAAGALAVDPATGELSGLLDDFGDYIVSVAYEESGRFLGTLTLLMTVNSGGAALAAGAFMNLLTVSPTYTGSLAFFRGAEGVTLTLAPNIVPQGFSVPAGVFAAPEGFTVFLTEMIESGQAWVARFPLAIRTSNRAEAGAVVMIMVQALTTGNLPDVVLREGPAVSPGARVTAFSLPGHPQAVYSITSDPDDLFTIRAGRELAVGTAALAAEQYAPAVHTLAVRAESESFLGTADFELRVIVDFAELKELPPLAREFAMKVSVAATTAGNDAEEVKWHVDSLLRGFDRRLQGLEDNWESADLRGTLLAAAIGSAAGQPAADAEAAREILTTLYDFRLAPPPEGKARFAHHNLLRLGITLTVEGVENVLLGDDPGHRHNSFRQPRKITAEYAGYHRGAHYIYTTGPRNTTVTSTSTKGALIRDAGTFPNGYQDNFCAAGGRGWRVVTFDELQGFRYYTKDDDNDLFKHDGAGGASIGGNLNAPLPGAFQSEARIVPIFPNHPKAVTMNLPSNIYGPARANEVDSFYESVFIDFYSALTLSPTGHHVPLRIQTANNLKQKLESEDPDSENLRGRIVCVLPDVDGEYDRPPPHSEVYYRANGRELVDTIDSTTGEVREIQATVLAGGGAFLTVTAAAYRLVRTGVEWLPDQNLTVSLRANLSVSMAVEPLEARAGKGVVRLIFSTQDAGLAGELYILTKTPRQVYFGSTNVLGVEEKGVYVLRVRVSSPPVVSTRTEGGRARQSFAGRVSSRRLDATALERLRRGASARTRPLAAQ